MGKKLDLSELTDEEAQHVWEVVRRDLELRRREEERLEELKGKIKKGSPQRELVSDAARLSETHCAHCLQPYRLLAAPKRRCLDCGLFTCPGCSHAHPAEGWLCHPCHLARVVERGSLEWYYGHVRARFKRFGSAKVVRSLCARLPGAGLSGRVQSWSSVRSGPEPSPGDGSGDGEQTDTDGERDGAAQAQPLSSKPVPPGGKRLLPIHSRDFEADSDDSAGPGRGPPSLSSAREALDSLQVPWAQALPGEPCPEGADARSSGRHSHAEVQTDSLPPASPGMRVAQGEPPPAQCLGDEDTSEEEEGARALGAASHPPRLSGWAASESQCPGAREPTDADTEEETLKRKLEELTSNISDAGASSEEEEEEGEGEGAGAEPGRSPASEHAPRTPPEASRSAGKAPRWGKSPPGPQDAPQAARTPDEALSELEGRAALTASEVSDIESRIAALRAAGLPVRPSGKPQRSSKLPVLLPRHARTPGPSPEHPPAGPADEVKVTAVPCLPGRRFRDSPEGQGGDGEPFNRRSADRGSLTQRSPHGRRGAAPRSFAKPVMIRQPCGAEARRTGQEEQPALPSAARSSDPRETSGSVSSSGRCPSDPAEVTQKTHSL